METVMPTAPTARWKKTASWCALAAGLVAMFTHVVAKMWYGWYPAWDRTDLSLWHRFTDGDSYYTHAPLILLVSGILIVFLVWRVRFDVKREVFWGRLAVAASVFFYVVGLVIDTNVIRGTAWVGLLASLVLLFWGRDALRKLWFPIAFLFFMIPLPMWLISDVNLALKLGATEWGVRLATFLGVTCDHAGADVFVANGKLTVGDPCSGLRTLISLLAFGAVYAYVCRLRGWWRIGLFAMTVPVALVANCVRIASIIVVAQIWDVETARGRYHDDSGLVVFALAFLLMFGLEKLVIAAHRWAGRPMKIPPLFPDLRPKGDRSHFEAMFLPVNHRRLLAMAAVGVLCGAMSWWLDRPAKTMWSQNVAAGALPPSLTVGATALGSASMSLDENTLTLLETRDYLYRRYSGLEQPVDMCVIFSKDRPASTHPPELCLQAGGGVPSVSNDIALDGVSGMGPVPCRELVVRQGQATSYYIYTFKYGDTYTARFGKLQVLVFFKSRLWGNASGALIRVSTPVVGSIDEARQRAMDFMRVSLPYLDRALK